MILVAGFGLGLFGPESLESQETYHFVLADLAHRVRSTFTNFYDDLVRPEGSSGNRKTLFSGVEGFVNLLVFNWATTL
jgi:hypothetical protein